MVAVLLLHDLWQPRLGPRSSGRDQAFSARDLQGRRFCQAEPENAARRLVDGGFAEHYDYALQTIEELPYDLWHEYDSADSLRFYALLLHEAGMVGSGPNALLAEGTDWRFVDELKRELKA